jgi:hypothetical protein
MRTKTMNLHHHLLVLATSVSLASCGAFGDDDEPYEKLDKLRVLAMRSEPPDLSVGETATLSANVYEPEERALNYEWSWCPSRADSAAAFECNISEDELQRAWTASGLDGSPPAYDLGTDSEAQLTHVLTPALVTALCQAPTLDPRIEAACFRGLEASIKLTVRSSEAELTAIKSVVLLLGDATDAERNTNPASDFDLTLRDRDGDLVVESGEPLQAGHRYTMVAGVDERSAEPFTPGARPGEPSAGERRETLVMTWFVTAGELASPDGDDGGIGDDFARTTFVDGRNDVADLAKNGWKIPLTAGSTAALHLVLRDERGGVGWTTRRFDVVGGRP